MQLMLVSSTDQWHRQPIASRDALWHTELHPCALSQAAAGPASLLPSQPPAYAALVRHAAHAAAASAPPQPRLPDHLGPPSGGGREAPRGQAADDLTFNSTIKDRLAGASCLPVHDGCKVTWLMCHKAASCQVCSQVVSQTTKLHMAARKPSLLL